MESSHGGGQTLLILIQGRVPESRNFPKDPGREVDQFNRPIAESAFKGSDSALTSADRRQFSGSNSMAKKKYTKRELEGFKKVLLQHRNVVTGNMSSLDGEGRGSSGDEGDLSSENFEIELTLSAMQSETNLVQEIDEALQRIDDGSYGICEDTGDLIPEARLQAIPWTRLCVEAQARRERS